MINVVFRKKNENIISFSVLGHAEYEENDEIIYDDVVCGSASILAQTAILGVTEVLGLNAPYKAQDGDIMLDLSYFSLEDIDKCQIVLSTILLSYERLKISYVEYIKVSVEEV